MGACYPGKIGEVRRKMANIRIKKGKLHEKKLLGIFGSFIICIKIFG